uniref:Uncharacterized protein n=1 Tax=Acrobeloides nanus TaxID=290746 RepID=A0A914E1B6_9BILA
MALGTAIFVTFVIFGSIMSEKVHFASGQPIIVGYLIVQLFLCLFSIILSVIAPFLYWKFKKHENGHPDPIDVPTPRDEFSLESERRTYEEHLDRMKKRMSAAVDSCVIELRMTLNNINEIVRYRTESKWRRRVWQVSYAKVEIGIFAALQLLNFIILMLVLYHWK